MQIASASSTIAAHHEILILHGNALRNVQIARRFIGKCMLLIPFIVIYSKFSIGTLLAERFQASKPGV
jgi:hypothetical protein